MPGDGGLELVRCEFVGNVANASFGGAIHLDHPGHVLPEDCVLMGNLASDGGAIDSDFCDLRPVRCLLSGNSAVWEGGARSVYTGQLLLESCTVIRNLSMASPPGEGAGGLHLQFPAVRIVDSIVSGNCSSDVSEVYIGYGTLTISCSAIPRSGVEERIPGRITWETEPVESDPLFCAPTGCPTDFAPLSGGDYRLRSDSPCLARFSPCGRTIGVYGEGCAAPEPVGACCVADTCRLLPASGCGGAGGTYEGDGTSCFPDPCDGTPTVPTSWGRIKASFR